MALHGASMGPRAESGASPSWTAAGVLPLLRLFTNAHAGAVADDTTSVKRMTCVGNLRVSIYPRPEGMPFLDRWSDSIAAHGKFTRTKYQIEHPMISNRDS